MKKKTQKYYTVDFENTKTREYQTFKFNDANDAYLLFSCLLKFDNSSVTLYKVENEKRTQIQFECGGFSILGDFR